MSNYKLNISILDLNKYIGHLDIHTSTTSSGINQAIRKGNVVALDMVNPQLSVHHDPRADV